MLNTIAHLKDLNILIFVSQSTGISQLVAGMSVHINTAFVPQYTELPVLTAHNMQLVGTAQQRALSGQRRAQVNCTALPAACSVLRRHLSASVRLRTLANRKRLVLRPHRDVGQKTVL